jgi:hypothetical protein
MIHKCERRDKKVWIVLMVVCCLLIGGAYSEAKRAKRPSDASKPKKIKYVKVPDGLKTIMALNKSNGKMLDEAKGETVNFDRARKAVEYGNLNIGATSDEVVEQVGHPVVKVNDEQTNTVQWVYKPGTSSFFEKYKISLIFDSNGILIGWKVPEKWKEDRDPKPESRGTVIGSK